MANNIWIIPLVITFVCYLIWFFKPIKSDEFGVGNLFFFFVATLFSVAAWIVYFLFDSIRKV
jgi:hypothetical protein